MNNDLISREALKKCARVVFDKDLGRLRVVDVSDIDNAPTVEPIAKIAEIKVTITEEKKQKIIEELQKQRFAVILPETQMEIVEGKCPIEAGGNCPLRQQGEWKTNLTTGDIFCSCCKEVRRDTRIKHINFCNSCGAKMKGGAK